MAIANSHEHQQIMRKDAWTHLAIEIEELLVNAENKGGMDSTRVMGLLMQLPMAYGLVGDYGKQQQEKILRTKVANHK